MTWNNLWEKVSSQIRREFLKVGIVEQDVELIFGVSCSVQWRMIHFSRLGYEMMRFLGLKGSRR